MKVLKNTSKLNLFLRLSSVCLGMIGFANNGIASQYGDALIEDLKKDAFSLRKSDKTDPISCLQIFQDIERINKAAGREYFDRMELQYLTANCTKYKPKPAPLGKKDSTPQQLPKPSENSDPRTRVTSALATLAGEPADVKNCQKRVELITTYDKLAELEGKPSYSMAERNYFLKACYDVVPAAKPLTHKLPKPSVPSGFMGELKQKMQKHQENKTHKEAMQELDNLLDEMKSNK